MNKINSFIMFVCQSICSSICPHVTTQLSLVGFSLNLIFKDFENPLEKFDSNLIKIRKDLCKYMNKSS